MLHIEAYGLMNAAISAASLTLGGRLSGLNAPRGGALLAWSLFGGATALTPLVCEPLSPVALATGLLAGVCGCYRGCGVAACVRATLTTLCAAMLLGGVATFAVRLGGSAVAGVALATGLCLFLCPLLKLLPTTCIEVRQVELRCDGRAVLLPAMLDSGNLLRDPISGAPVLVVSARAVRSLFPQLDVVGLAAPLPAGFRLLSVKTAAGSALLPLFRPDLCRLYLGEKIVDADVRVAVAPQAYEGVQALVPMAAVSAAV